MIHIHYHHDASHHHLHITGHAGYAPRGQDIVCAGISALAYGLLEYLRQSGAEARFSLCPGALTIACADSPESRCAFDLALAGWRNIANTYPQHAEVHTKFV